jgi:aromatic ring-cleaving dioxygenase
MTTATPAIHGYHVHVYYDAETRITAERLRSELIERFPVRAGELHDGPQGPHPVPQFQVIFKADAFQSVVPWMMLHRQGLDVLVHPLTDDMVDDHTDYALWIGTPIGLRIDTLKRRGYSAALLPAETVTS